MDLFAPQVAEFDPVELVLPEVGAEHVLLLFAAAACWTAACGAAVSGTVLSFLLPHLGLLAASGCLAGCAPVSYVVICVVACADFALSEHSPRFRLERDRARRHLRRLLGRIVKHWWPWALCQARSLSGKAWAQLGRPVLEELQQRPPRLRVARPDLVPDLARRACRCLWCLLVAWFGSKLGAAVGGWLGACAAAVLSGWAAIRLLEVPRLQAALAIACPAAEAAAREAWSGVLVLAAELAAEEPYPLGPGGRTDPEKLPRLCLIILRRFIAKARARDTVTSLLCDWLAKLFGNPDSLPELARNVGVELLAGTRSLPKFLALPKLPARLPSPPPPWLQLVILCHWLPCALGSLIVKHLLTCALVFTLAHCKLLASDLQGAGESTPAHAVALWLFVKRRPGRLVKSMLIGLLGVPISWLLHTWVLSLLVPLSLGIALYVKPSLQDSFLLACCLAVQPLVDCMPSMQELEILATQWLSKALVPFETFECQVFEAYASDKSFKYCLGGGLLAGLAFTVLGFLGGPLLGAFLHLLLCAGLVAAAAEQPLDARGLQLAFRLQAFSIGLAAFMTVELAVGGYIFALGPQILHLVAQQCWGPLIEEFITSYMGIVLGPFLGSMASDRLGPRCMAWLSVFYEPLLGSELGNSVGGALGSWLGVGLGVWAAYLIGGLAGAFLGIWLAGPVGLLGMPFVWLVVLMVWLQVQCYSPGFAFRRGVFDLWLLHERIGSQARLLKLPVDSDTSPVNILAATLQNLEPGLGPLLVHFADAGEEGEPVILMRCWVGHLAEAMVSADPLPMLIKWEEESKVYGLNYEWLTFYRRTCGSPGRWGAWQARLADLDASTEQSFWRLGVIFGCCLLEGHHLVPVSPVLFDHLVEVKEERVDVPNSSGTLSPDSLGGLDFAFLKELCPDLARKLRIAEPSEDGALEVQLPAHAVLPRDPLRVPAPSSASTSRPSASSLGAAAAGVLENCHVAMQLRSFRSGFAAAVGLQELPELLSPREIRQLLAGEPLVDIEDWERHARYAEGFSAATLEVRLFWTALRELSQGDLQIVCKLATGLPGPPFGGFSALSAPFVLSPQKDSSVKVCLLYTHQSVVEVPRCRGGLAEMRKQVATIIESGRSLNPSRQRQ